MVLLINGFSLRAAQDQQLNPRIELSGVWIGFAVEGKGETPDRGPVKVQLTITPDLIQGKELQGETVIDHGEGWYSVETMTSPKFLDATKNGRRNERWLGIYSLEGDTLKWCVGRRERPSEFETKKGAFLLILKRQKP